MTGNNESFHACAIDLRIVLRKIRDVIGRGRRCRREWDAAVVPGCARNTPRPKRTPATAMPLWMRNFFLVSDLFMNATLGRVHQIYFSNIAIFFCRHSMVFPPRPRRHSTTLTEQRAKRAQAGEPAFQTNRCHRDSCFLEQKLCPIQSTTIEILMRRLTKHRLKHPKQMERRQTRRCGDIRQ